MERPSKAMGTLGWDDFREKLKRRARFTLGYVVTWRGKRCRINGRYWRQQTNGILYDLREIGTDGAYVRNHPKVPEHELLER